MKKAPLLVAAVVVVSIGVLAIPVKQTCGVVGYTCAAIPDAYGNIHYYFEVQPLIAEAYEAIAGSDFPFRYSAGVELLPIR